MRILYDHQVFAMQKYGGISRYFYELASRISSYDNCEMDLFQGLNINEYAINEYKEFFNRYFSVNCKMIPKICSRRLNFNNLLFNYFVKNNEYDIYHPSYYEYFNKPLKTALIVTVHDMIHELYHEQFINDKTISEKREIIKKANGIIAVSENTKRDLINILDVEENKIKVIYHGNSLKYKVSETPIYKEPYLLYVGQRNGYKNFERLLLVFSKLDHRNEIKLLCFGGGHFKAEEIKLMEKLKIKKNVNLIFGGDDILANLYAHATAFIYPSLYEGFGIPILEAMYYKCPVLASKTSSIPEVLESAGIYFEPTSVEDMCCKIDKFLSNEKNRVEFINKGIEQEKKFSWNKCAEETFLWYETVAGK